MFQRTGTHRLVIAVRAACSTKTFALFSRLYFQTFPTFILLFESALSFTLENVLRVFSDSKQWINVLAQYRWHFMEISIKTYMWLEKWNFSVSVRNASTFFLSLISFLNSFFFKPLIKKWEKSLSASLVLVQEISYLRKQEAQAVPKHIKILFSANDNIAQGVTDTYYTWRQDRHFWSTLMGLLHQKAVLIQVGDYAFYFLISSYRSCNACTSGERNFKRRNFWSGVGTSADLPFLRPGAHSVS